MPRFLTIIPAYNEQSSIAMVVADIRKALPEGDVLVVCDGSTDTTALAAARAGAAVLVLPLNLGIGGAVQAGYRWATLHDYDVVLRLDADGQHDPAWADALVQPILSGEADVTIGSRFVKRLQGNHQPPPLRRLGILLFSRVVSAMTHQPILDPTSGFRCVNQRAAAFSARSHPYDFPEVESVVHYAQAGFKIVEVPVVMRDRSHGTSTITGFRAAYYAVKVLLALAVLTFGKSKFRDSP
ncbi:MAG: glycosyltransferase [Gammaproteobacteria bacterium]|nr:glycosyltransferase [Gammaproteobacteria bacterium]